MGLFAAGVDWSCPAFRLFFRFWVTEGAAPGSVVICEALRFPRVGSSDSAGGRGARFWGSTTGMCVLEEVAAASPTFCSVVNQKDARRGVDALPSIGLVDPH